MLNKTQARADVRALVGAVAIGSAMGLLLGASYLAGGAARSAVAHARAVRIADAAAGGFSEATLQAEAADMDAGALAVARRHDPYIAQGPAQRDRETVLFAARLERPASPPVLRAVYLQPVAPARPLRMVSDGPLEGARELDCLSQAVYYEARGESSEGQAAVAQVVLNRVRHPAFPKSVCSVVYQGAQTRTCQFSFACDGSTRHTREGSAWRRAQIVAARALAGFVMADVGNATHFHVARLGGVWGAGMMRVAQVGAHVFYRFSGHSRGLMNARGGSDLYVPPADLPDGATYASAAGSSLGSSHAAPSMLLASAVTTTPLGQGGPLGPAPEPASGSSMASKSASSSEKPAAAPVQAASTKAAS